MEYNINLPAQQALNNANLLDNENESWKEIVRWLRTEFQSKNQDFTFSEATIHRFLQILHRITNKFSWYNYLEVTVAEALTETLKAFRLYVTNERVAAHLVQDPSFHDIFSILTKCLFTKKNGPELYTKYLVQFFLNLLSVGNKEQKKHIKAMIRAKPLEESFLFMFYNAYGYFYEVSAVIYNLYCDRLLENETLISHILEYHADANKTNEYVDFLIEKIVSEHFVWQNYELIKPLARLQLFNCLKEMFIHYSLENLIIKVGPLSEVALKCLVDIFNRCVNVVFQVTQQGDSKAIEEVSCILELLAHLSSDEKYLPFLQHDKDIFINASVLLINAHRLGKSTNNVFSPLQKLSEIHTPSADIRRNPVFGFKADLVRLIGNLCWKNKRLQDLARESEVIPVLLDSCNIDAKNPFIIQWTILAIRNICDHNSDNQAIIAGLTQQGVVRHEVLQEFGLTLHAEEDLSIGIVQLNINK